MEGTNWKDFEQKVATILRELGLNGNYDDIRMNRFVTGIWGFIGNIAGFLGSYMVINGDFGDERVMFVKYGIYNILVGLCCNWNRIGYCLSVGTIKNPIELGFGDVRTMMDVGLYVGFISVLVYGYIVDDFSEYVSLTIIGIMIFLVYYFVVDKVTYLSCKPEYYGYFLLFCIINDDAYLYCAQFIQIFIWIWNGISKVGVWYAYLHGYQISSIIFSRYIPNYIRSLYIRYPIDYRPSNKSETNSLILLFLEIGSGVFLLCPLLNYYTNIIGISSAIIYHLFNVITLPNKWQGTNIYYVIYLFYINEFQVNKACINIMILHRRYLLILMCLLFIIPLIGQLYPNNILHTMAFRYHTSNVTHNIFIINKDAFKTKILPKIVIKSKFKSSDIYQHGWVSFSKTVLSTVIAKTLLNILQQFLFQYSSKYNINLNNNYFICSSSFMTKILYGISFNDNRLISIKSLQSNYNLNKWDIFCIQIDAIGLMEHYNHIIIPVILDDLFLLHYFQNMYIDS